METSAMIEPLDIFHLEKDGTVIWRGTAETFDEAKLRVKNLATLSPGDYVILNQMTGKKTLIRLDAT